MDLSSSTTNLPPTLPRVWKLKSLFSRDSNVSRKYTVGILLQLLLVTPVMLSSKIRQQTVVLLVGSILSIMIGESLVQSRILQVTILEHSVELSLVMQTD